MTIDLTKKKVEIIGFQSLFWWILYCDPIQYYINKKNRASFNPCFGGSYIVTSSNFLPPFIASFVSILVLVDLILWHPHHNRREKNILVSILVLVDLILWLHLHTTRKNILGCFNPCFGGSYIVTTPSFRSDYYYQLFQSLFWWILYCDLAGSEEFAFVDYVSILVLVDLILWPDIEVILCLLLISFNPCFGGSYIMTWFGSIFSVYRISFNPCFGGSYIMTYKQMHYGISLFEFQSLFWWILYYDHCWAPVPSPLPHVSILVLVDLILWP